MYKVDNAIIMAAGTSSRFAPLSFEKPKALIEVKGEILIERQIKQLREAGIDDIYVVTGYMSGKFEYLHKEYGVTLIKNDDFLLRNNHSSIYIAREFIKNSYICSADNYYVHNPFKSEEEQSFYTSVFAAGKTDEWCLKIDSEGFIKSVDIGGSDAWCMVGHAFWDEHFSKLFIDLLEKAYFLEEVKNMFWENFLINHLDVLKMKAKKYPANYIFEFDTIDELRLFDTSYLNNTRSIIIKGIAEDIGCCESEITHITCRKGTKASAVGFTFIYDNKKYLYLYDEKKIRVV